LDAPSLKYFWDYIHVSDCWNWKIYIKLTNLKKTKPDILKLGLPINTYVPRKLLFWAEQQLVAIPGWLREDQKEGLHQEENFASRKQPRCPILRRMRQKENFLLWWGGGGGFKMATQAILLPTPSGDFWSRACECPLKVHKNENIFGFDFEFFTISMSVMHK
jgi:hypothetical protein